MSATVTKQDSTLAAIEAALPIEPQTYIIGDRPTGLIVVDVVNCFCTIGYVFAPQQPDAQISTMVSETNRLAQSFVAKGLPIMVFLDTHQPGKPEPPYPTHCEKGSGEEKLVTELEWLENHPLATLVEKDCINGFIGAIDIDTGRNLLLEWISDRKLEALVVVGICTDICVMDLVTTMLSVRNHALSPTLKDIVVYAKGCATHNITAEMALQQGLPKTAIHPQKIAHHIGLYTMTERGAIIADTIKF
ncbi:MAG TPA: isochorismatase [Cyanobacteria bacterium UBA11149]|nr:isochorismatase [Cyanobacteria bacterium UBA11367]HBE59605.1 isochorismatase [Cyanobacteria bacterium UBA11366]HBK65141.1 isochorismatase [Cyanobacteria bacterium UBA11166]HBR75444.1 isochorismatase [Cyanobacteria bacterium UBA11159]HBS70014.1 isochorismatase [Cyanobacteria bacterium UBA11153]HBW91991.1 isochorismatase [Cyanobacteria bacterium UBA11149]HCA94123.1 isochorismatase [Cyanobacteria bacterium UBA9226]